MAEGKDNNLIPMKTAMAIIVSVLVVVLLVAGVPIYFIFGGANQGEELGQELREEPILHNNENKSINKIVDNSLDERNSANPKIPKYIKVVLKKEMWVKGTKNVENMYINREDGHIYYFSTIVTTWDNENNNYSEVISTEDGYYMNVLSSEQSIAKVPQTKIRILEPIEEDIHLKINTEFYEIRDMSVDLYSLYSLYDYRTKDQFYINGEEIIYYNISTKLPLDFEDI